MDRNPAFRYVVVNCPASKRLLMRAAEPPPRRRGKGSLPAASQLAYYSLPTEPELTRALGEGETQWTRALRHSVPTVRLTLSDSDARALLRALNRGGPREAAYCFWALTAVNLLANALFADRTVSKPKHNGHKLFVDTATRRLGKRAIVPEQLELIHAEVLLCEMEDDAPEMSMRLAPRGPPEWLALVARTVRQQQLALGGRTFAGYAGTHSLLEAHGAPLAHCRPDELARMAAGGRVVLHGTGLRLLRAFVAANHERQPITAGYGTFVDSVAEAVARLLRTRCMSHTVGLVPTRGKQPQRMQYLARGPAEAHDVFVVADPGTTFAAVGTPEQRAPLAVPRFLSDDEVLLSSYLGVYVESFVWGPRDDPAGPPRMRALCAGLVMPDLGGVRHQEGRLLLITAAQNTAAAGYGLRADARAPRTRWLRLCAETLGDTRCLLAHEEVAAMPAARRRRLGIVRIGDIGGRPAFLHAELFVRHLRLLLAPFFHEANRYFPAASPGVVRVPRWTAPRPTAVPAALLADLYAAAVAAVLQEVPLPRVRTVELQGFPRSHGVARLLAAQRPAGPAVALTQGWPTSAVAPPAPLAVCYAWEADTYPGNEVFGDATRAHPGIVQAKRRHPGTSLHAAAHSFIAQLQDPEINVGMYSRCRVWSPR